jgi:hypothetical protein
MRTVPTGIPMPTELGADERLRGRVVACAAVLRAQADR